MARGASDDEGRPLAGRRLSAERRRCAYSGRGEGWSLCEGSPQRLGDAPGGQQQFVLWQGQHRSESLEHRLGGLNSTALNPR